jgi:hypothetical protein
MLPNAEIAIEVPTVLYAKGPVTVVEGRTVEVEAHLELDADAMRYRLARVAVGAGQGDEIDPELLRQIRWAEMVVPALDTFGRIITVDKEGRETRHRGPLTLTETQRLAGLWLQAKLAGIDPNVYIAEQLDISPTAAAARVRRARTMKLIPPATPGQRR